MKFEQLKKDLKKFEGMYQTGSPLFVTLQQARLAICDLESENQEYEKHAHDFEEMYKQEHREKNALKRQLESMNTV